MLSKLLPIVLFIVVFGSVNAQTTYYADVSRPNNSGAGTSWATAKKDLQVVINAAASGDQIWVKAGTYLPTHDPFANVSPANNRDKTFSLKSGVSIYGGFAGTETALAQRNVRTNVTLLSGDLGVLNTLTDNAYHVVLSVNCSNTTRLDGFTITKGYAVANGGSSITVGGRLIDRYKGGGVSNYYSSPTFANCTISANSADCSDMNDDSWGAGMDCLLSSSLIENCRFEGNSFLVGGGSFGVFGAGISINGAGTTLNKCFFYNNTSGSGFLDGSRGGAIYIGATTTITNTVVYNNAAMNGAALFMGGGGFNTSAITNCSFVNNTSSFAGTGYVGFSKSIFRNCIFWNNAPTSTQVAGRNEIYSQETMVANQPTFSNCIIRDATGSPLAVTNTTVTASLNSNPSFLALADGDGADNIWGTTDDGLRLQCGSPAVGAGTAVTATSDVLDIPRTTPFDIGAYEGNHVNGALNSIPSAASTVIISQSATGVSNYSNCGSELLAIRSGGTYTLSGQTTARVWIEGTQPSTPGVVFVKRHYEINPLNNGASAKVTLYFTQQEFNDFNAVSVVDLPTGPSDAIGKQNLKVEKRAGVSSNGTGLPGTYSGAASTIDPADADIVWNSTASRWEVSFDVTGFSGFFVKTSLSSLPLRLVDFSVSQTANCNTLQWKTASEINTKEFQVEKSTDGISFAPIAIRNAAGTGAHTYEYPDCSISSGTSYYRLKMVDQDGAYTYSPVVRIDKKATTQLVRIYPNPAKNAAMIYSDDASLRNTDVKMVDAIGNVVLVEKMTQFPHSLTISKLPAGVYYLHFNNGTNLRLVKSE